MFSYFVGFVYFIYISFYFYEFYCKCFNTHTHIECYFVEILLSEFYYFQTWDHESPWKHCSVWRFSHTNETSVLQSNLINEIHWQIIICHMWHINWPNIFVIPSKYLLKYMWKLFFDCVQTPTKRMFVLAVTNACHIER